ncbi:MAG: hypothetical protein HKO59_04250 [Phycisphaerales bacterium]|nr:VCBS repeat-containing protein [Phycisphaerae bacterium]NNF44485.1 hypothetical protein [Phycisphaerales bacterium]NNM25188.1 hypothetical protein [Phycisphaerales bacterium]
MRLAVLVACLLCSFLVGCRDAATPPPAVDPAPRLTDVTAASGLVFTTTSGRTPPSQILEVKGVGIGLVDVDGDGDLDVFVPNGATLETPDRGPGVRLFVNDGRGRFHDGTRAAGLTVERWSLGVAAADYDDDGDQDLYLTCFGPDVLLRNRGDGTFEDITTTAGVDVGGWSTGAAFGDLDGDGDLDLYVTRYLHFDPVAPPPLSSFRGVPVFAGPRGLPPAPDVLLENTGDGRFRDASVEAGISGLPPSYGLSVLVLDLDGDDRLDVFVGNDSVPNYLLRRRHDTAGLQFENVGVESGIATSGDGSPRATMGIAVGDVDGDGGPDVFTTNFTGEPNTLHVGRPSGFFDDATTRYGLLAIGRRFVGWGAAFADLDHDGDEDLLYLNGHVYPDAVLRTLNEQRRQLPHLLERDGERFTRIISDAPADWLNVPRCARALALGDLDGDGDLDAVTAGVNEPVRVLRNDHATGAWIMVAPDHPIGCRVTVRRGEETWTRWIPGGGGFLSATPPIAHVGLGSDDGPVTVEVRWPGGTTRTLEGATPGRVVRVGR